MYAAVNWAKCCSQRQLSCHFDFLTVVSVDDDKITPMRVLGIGGVLEVNADFLEVKISRVSTSVAIKLRLPPFSSPAASALPAAPTTIQGVAFV